MEVELCISDYRVVSVTEEFSQPRALRVKDTVSLHKNSVHWLKCEIAKAKKKHEKVVILTHHAPCIRLVNPQEFHTNVSSAFGFGI